MQKKFNEIIKKYKRLDWQTSNIMKRIIWFKWIAKKNHELTIKNFIDSFKDKVSFIINLGIIILLLLYIFTIFNDVANTKPLNLEQCLYVIILTLLAVLPFDILKLNKEKVL